MTTKSGLTTGDFLTEKEVMEFFGISKRQMEALRYEKELPFVRVDTRHRLYFEQDLVDWMLGRRIRAGQSYNQADPNAKTLDAGALHRNNEWNP